MIKLKNTIERNYGSWIAMYFYNTDLAGPSYPGDLLESFTKNLWISQHQ